MNAQAEQMRAYVGELMDMVGGAVNGNKARNTARTVAKVGKIKEVLHLAPKKRNKGKTETQGLKTSRNPEMVIPLEQEDFRDF